MTQKKVSFFINDENVNHPEVSMTICYNRSESPSDLWNEPEKENICLKKCQGESFSERMRKKREHSGKIKIISEVIGIVPRKCN